VFKFWNDEVMIKLFFSKYMSLRRATDSGRVNQWYIEREGTGLIKTGLKTKDANFGRP
jgi:hypothetical protein